MRSLIQNVLADVSKDGALPGDHHFFVTFDTMHPDVEMADWLSDRYPNEVTIVIQHWFDNLDVTDEGFAITLNVEPNPAEEAPMDEMAESDSEPEERKEAEVVSLDQFRKT